MHRRILLALTVTGLLASTAHANNLDNVYVSVKALSAQQSLTDMQPYSVRAQQMLSGPGTARSGGASIALGYALPADWRVEAEYTAPQKSQFNSFWSPFSANVQHMETKSQRLMVNGYKDLPLNNQVSLYGTVGAGLAMIKADGFQGNPGRPFDQKSQTNFAYGLGVGADYHVSKKVTLGVGYRYTDMGKIKTGLNDFANVASARDEQLNGKLSQRDLFLELRARF
ncbi:Opacity protein [Collimonas sp. OK307]|uniref:outer membrane protein n=1 Tax=Collimonas sp. OK307 TaxID=1801620 RepID=UPI0008E91839|nr:acyloxyacyl hydrolase [Collimonas sp. OK307]SFH84475.1 Opacity protein [Collimonas sp. OK307]